MCSKFAVNLVNSAAQVRQIFAKGAANVRRIVSKYVCCMYVCFVCWNYADFCWKASQTLLHEVSLVIFLKEKKSNYFRAVAFS